MGKYTDNPIWEEEVLIPDTFTPVLGGQPVWEGDRLVDGFFNVPVGILADRTRFLKNRVDGIEGAISGDLEGFLKSEENLADLEDIPQARYNLGLNLVDNVRDLDKPISNLTQEAFNEVDAKLSYKVDDTDPRLTDSREWVAEVVPQVEAETGTSTTARKWTAQRVRQAISAFAAPLTRNINTGTGLQGGGNLTEDRTLSVNFGNAAGTVTEGNDSRLSNSREWTASVVTQAEAETGTATTARKWTAQRVRQAIVAWWNSTGLQSTIEGKANSSTTLTAGNGLTGGGDLSANRSFVLGTPSTITGSTTNSVSSTSHTHAISVAVGDVSGLTTALNNKVDKVAGMGLSQENFTTAEKNKLSSLEEPHFKGMFSSLAALIAAVPSPVAGDYAQVAGANPGDPSITYAWDASLSEWREQIPEISPEQVKSLYESNPDTNVFTDLEKSKLGNAVVDSDPRLTNAREWTANTVSQAEAEAGTATTARKWTAQRVRQAILGWWNNSTDKTKLDGISAQATKNQSDAYLLSRANHTGTQPASTITGLHTVATSGSYDDLSNKPSIPTLPSTVSQSEAETGTATTVRGWSALRVRQSTTAWWNSTSVPVAKITGLGTAATADLGTGANSAARGNHTHTQYWDITTSTGYAPSKDLNEYEAGEGGYTRSTDANSPGTGYNLVTLQGFGTSDRTQLALPQRNVQDIKYRSRNTNGTWEPWSTVWSTHNFDPDTKLGATANAVSATRLNTARTINGASFNGTANITTTNWGTARNLTVGNTAKSVNGSANVSWSLAEIGAAPSASPTFTGDIQQNGSVRASYVSTSGAMDLSTSNYFYASRGANTTFSFSNVPANAFAFTLRLTLTAEVVLTWPTTVNWPADDAPTFGVGTHLITFVKDTSTSVFRAVVSLDYAG